MKKNKSSKKIKIDWNINKIFSIIALITNFIFLILLLILNVLPFKFSLPILIICIGIDGLLILFSFVKELKSKKTKVIHVILSSILGIISIIGSCYLFKTIIFMGGIGTSNYKTENYSVIVLKDSNYETLEDIKDKEIGMLNDSDEDILKVKEHIDSKVKVDYKEFATVQDLEKDLLSNDIEVIVVEDSYKTMMEEINSDFSSLTKVIYTFSIKIKVDDISKSIDVTNNPFSIYISGIDTYGKISSVSRSDVNIVATVNPTTNQVLLVSIPRDYYVKLHGTTGYNDKITHAGFYGVDMSVKTIEDLLGIDINYYVKVNFSSVIDIVDVLGGIDVYSEYTFTSYSGYRFNKGYNNMNGKEALDFARTRKAFASGDRQRGKNQQAVIEALIRKVTSSAVITKYTSLLDSLEGSFETNLNNKEITSLAKFQLDKMPSWTVKSISLDGSDSYNYTYSYSGGTSYVMVPYEKSIKDAQTALSEILGGAVQESSYDKVNNVQQPTKVPTENNDTNNSEPTINLSIHDITINVGDKTTLRALINNYSGKVNWSSSDENIATVNEGVVVALKSGTITIKAEIEGKSDSCIVRINNPLDTLLPNNNNSNSDKNEDNNISDNNSATNNNDSDNNSNVDNEQNNNTDSNINTTPGDNLNGEISNKEEQ